MKTFVTSIFLITSILCNAQTSTINLPFDSVTHKITYSGIVKLDSTRKKDELYSTTLEWFAKTYNSGKDVIQLQDKDNGKIIGNGAITVHTTQRYKLSFEEQETKVKTDVGYVKYSISIYLKDGKYKYLITDLFFKSTNQYYLSDNCENLIHTTQEIMGFSYQPYYNYILWQTDNQIKELISNLETVMKTKPVSNDKW